MKRKAARQDVINHNASKKRRASTEEDDKSSFRKGLFDKEVLKEYRSAYAGSKPYKHGVIQNLIDPTLLRNVRIEIQSNLSFTPKETDIYKIYQSGDLANLSGLDDSSLRLLPSLLKLRNALYSPAFRQYISTIAGSGPLSGRKTDMAINVYTPGCHLLCHDDVIGSRRVSYILYLTDPDIPWKPQWGGALRLYPTESMKAEDGTVAKVPSPEFNVSIPPSFNQLSFFAVQPGESFHDVEEVYHRRKGGSEGEEVEEDGGRVRMAISGWFHIPQEGEEGYEEGLEERMAEKSSLAQLQGKADQFDLPQPRWRVYPEEAEDIPAVDAGLGEEAPELTEEDLNFLLKYMTPTYLTPDTMEELRQMFEEESSLKLANVLSKKYAPALREYLEENERNGTFLDPLDEGWHIARPPHKHRFLYRQSLDPAARSAALDIVQNFEASILNELIDDLFPSPAFKKWLSLATGLTLKACNVLARRFRRGVDYTLATSYDKEDPQLEVCLGITPTTGWGNDGDDEDEDKNEQARNEGDEGGEANESKDLNSKTSETKDRRTKSSPTEETVTEGGVGGYELYMAGDDSSSDDNASSASASASSDHGVSIPPHLSSIANSNSNSNGTSTSTTNLKITNPQPSNTGAGKRRGKADPAVYQAAAAGDEDDGVLFSMGAGWNVMSIVLRDTGVLRFVKYVGRSAPGDRWDVVGEFAVEGEGDGEEDGYGNGNGEEEEGGLSDGQGCG